MGSGTLDEVEEEDAVEEVEDESDTEATSGTER